MVCILTETFSWFSRSRDGARTRSFGKPSASSTKPFVQTVCVCCVIHTSTYSQRRQMEIVLVVICHFNLLHYTQIVRQTNQFDQHYFIVASDCWWLCFRHNLQIKLVLFFSSLLFFCFCFNEINFLIAIFVQLNFGVNKLRTTQLRQYSHCIIQHTEQWKSPDRQDGSRRSRHAKVFGQ